MSLFTIAAIYLVVWWLVLFAVLPWGVRGQAEENDVTEGTEPGAPVRPDMWRKVAITTVISAVLTGLFIWAGLSGLLDIREWELFQNIPGDFPESDGG